MTSFCATVKSALPTEMIAVADCSSPLLVTSMVTTAITAMAREGQAKRTRLSRPDAAEDEAEKFHGELTPSSTQAAPGLRPERPPIGRRGRTPGKGVPVPK